MSVIRRTCACRTKEQTRRARDSKLLLHSLSLALLLFCSSAPVAARDFDKSLVKVHLNREFLGLLHRNQLIPQTRVHEVAVFQGAIFDARGYVVAYVGNYGPYFSVPGARVAIEFSGGELRPARPVGVDERIALLVCESSGGAPDALTLGSSLRGETPLFVSPGREGNWEVHSPSLFHVEPDDRFPEDVVQVSGLSRKVGGRAWEGSFVMDEVGQLLGIVSRAEHHPMSQKIDVCRVLPAEIIRRSVDRILKEEQNVRAGWLGIFFDVERQRTLSGQEVSPRARIRDVVSGSPAQEAGLKPGDVILQVDGKPVESAEKLVRVIRWKSEGEKVTLSIDRQGQLETVSALLTRRQDRRPMISWALEVPPFWDENLMAAKHLRLYRTVLPSPLQLGFEVEPLTSQLADYFHAPEGGGLLVKSILEDSLAAMAGFLAGDVLTQINGRDISSSSDLQHLLRSAQEGVVVIRFIRDRQPQTQKLILH